MGKFSGVGTVKKAVSMKIQGDQDFTAEKGAVNEEINKLASNSFQGEVKAASSETLEAIAVPEEVVVKGNIRETVEEISQEDVEGIKRVVKEAEENSKIKTKLADAELELGKLTARFEKASEDLVKFALIADKLLEDLSEEDIKIFMQTDDAAFYRNIVKKATQTV
ncbi:MAG: hypothetical protein KAG98_05065 [Lentisphaeria bacterium]|nr:hypothetical protein [Lentisphaeria bacterium]